MSLVRNKYPVSYVRRSTNRRPSSRRRVNASISPEYSHHSAEYTGSPMKKKKKKTKTTVRKKTPLEELIRKKNQKMLQKKAKSSDSYYSLPSGSTEELTTISEKNPKMLQKKTKESRDSFYSIPPESIEKHQISTRSASKKKRTSSISKESKNTKKSSAKTIETVSPRGTQEPWSDGRFLEHLPSLYTSVETPEKTSSTMNVRSLFRDSSPHKVSARETLEKKSSPSPHIVKGKELSKKDSPKPLNGDSSKGLFKRHSPKPLIGDSSKELSKKDSPKPLIKDSSKELSKKDSPKPLVRDKVGKKEFSKKGFPKHLIEDSSKESSKRDSPKCTLTDCAKASSKKCSSCLTETINKVFSKSCFPSKPCSLGNRSKKKTRIRSMKVIFQDPRTEKETTVIIDDEDDRAPVWCAPFFTSDCFKKREPTSPQNVPKKLHRSNKIVDVNDPNKGKSSRRRKSRSKNGEPPAESSCHCFTNTKLKQNTSVYSAQFLTRYKTSGFKKIRPSKVNSSSNNSLHGHCRVCSILDRGLHLHNLHLLEQRNELMHSDKARNSFLNTERSQVMESLYLQSTNNYVTENLLVEKRGKYLKRINEVRQSKNFIIPSDHLVESKNLQSKQFTVLNQTSSASSEFVHLSQLRSTSIIATYSSGMLTHCSEQCAASIGPKLSKYNDENYKNKQIKNSIWNRLFKIFYQNKPFKTKNVGV